MRFSANVASLTPSATLALAARARQMREEGLRVVDLSAGEPTFGTPDFAAQAGITAIRAGRTGYPPTRGIPELRSAIVRYLQETTAHAAEDDSGVLVSAGVKQALFNAIFCLFGPGDEVLVPAPYWPSYPALIELAGARPVIVPTAWEHEFRLDVELLERSRTARTRGLIINSPGNPTGVVYDLDRLRRIAAWCAQHGVWLLSDEIYRRLHYGSGPAPSIYDVEDRPEHVLLLDGVSKAFCMTGWRIGFAVGPPELVARATDLQSQTTSGAAAPSQYAAAMALGDAGAREAAIRSNLSRLRRNRRLGCDLLSNLDALEVRAPAGAIYLFVRLGQGSGTEEDTPETTSLAVAERLLQEAGVAGIPGEPFGSPGYLRFNFAVSEDQVEDGFRRVRNFFEAAT
ncbi:MAG: aminotransferase class I/II-fold pyridoxal phosphate-dependent enzyme [Gemmatimonadota bacterium]